MITWSFPAPRSFRMTWFPSRWDGLWCSSTCATVAGRTFWARLQVELLNRKRWKTRIELANAIFEYLEIFHNRQRRHSALEMRTPIEHETLHTQPSEVA